MRCVMRVRVALVAVVTFAVIGVVGVAGSSTPAAAIPFIPSPCDLAPIPALEDACNLANDPVGSVAGVVVGGADAVTGGVASNIFDKGLTWLAGKFAETIGAAVDGLATMLAGTPGPPIDTDWFATEYAQLIETGLGLSVIVCVIHLIGCVIRFRVWEMGRTFAMFCLAAFGVATGPLWIAVALQVSDAFTAAFLSLGGDDAGKLADRVADVTKQITDAAGLGLVTPILVVIVLFFAVCLVLFWMVLLIIRSVIIYVGTLAIPFVLPSIIDGKMRFARIYFKFLFGVILAEPVLVGVMCAGAALMRDGYVGQGGLYPLLTGIVIMAVAAFLPLTVLKMFGLATPVAVALERSGRNAVNVARSGTQKATVIAAGAVSGGALLPLAAGAAAMSSSHRTPPPRPLPASPAPATPTVMITPPTTGATWTTTPTVPPAISPGSAAAASSSD